MAHSLQDLEKSIHYYSQVNAQIIQELIEADQLLRKVGFENGLETVKEAARAIIHMQQHRTEIL